MSGGARLKSAADAFFGTDRDRIRWSRAEFADREIESDYQRHIVDHELTKERIVTLLGVVTYFIFGILDVITFKERLDEVLMVRVGVCGPIALLLVLASGFNPFRRWFQWTTAAVLAIGSLSMVWMIAIMPSEGGPPYIVGILSIFIFFSCIQRIHFWLAASVFVGTGVAYAVTVTTISPKAGLEVASGLFFIVFITMVALGTMYAQEIRSRLLYFRNRQRELDAAFIEELLIEATAADQSKLNFLSLLSHELRTPLHQIIGFADVVRLRSAGGEERAFLDQIHSSAHTLLGRIAKMLRYADATAGKIRYEVEECSARELIDAVCGQCAAAAAARGVTLDGDDVAKGTLRLDFSNTVYALGNLVDNAINASPKGARVRVSGRVDDVVGGYVIEVIDEGVGMSAEKIAAAFEPFSQAEALRTRSIEGVGLGLTLARKILVDQKAELTLTSQVGRGSTAFVRVPLATAGAAAA